MAAGIGLPAPVQVAVFAGVAVLLLGLVRPVAHRHRRQPAPLRTGAAALLGRQAVAMTQVDRNGGQVRIGGEVWSARTYDTSQVIPAGGRGDVVEIDGATAVVLPLEDQ